MAYVLTTASIVGCGHTPGKVTLGLGSSKLKVSGMPVLLAADVVPKPVSGCVATPKCVSSTVLNPAGGLAKKLTIGGQGVVLSTLTGSTQSAGTPPTPYALLKADSANQTLLQAV